MFNFICVGILRTVMKVVMSEIICQKKKKKDAIKYIAKSKTSVCVPTQIQPSAKIKQDSHFITTIETSLCKKPKLSGSSVRASLFLTIFRLFSPPNTRLQRWRLNWTWFGGDCRSRPHSQQLTEMSGASNSSYSVCLWWKGLPPWVIGYQFKMEIDIHLFPFSPADSSKMNRAF